VRLPAAGHLKTHSTPVYLLELSDSNTLTLTEQQNIFEQMLPKHSYNQMYIDWDLQADFAGSVVSVQ